MTDFIDRGSPAKSIHTSVDFERLSSESPLEHFRSCRALLYAAHRSDSGSEILKAFDQMRSDPVGRHFQPSQAALALVAHLLGKEHEPVKCMLFASNAPIGDSSGARLKDRLLPVPIARQYADILDELGQRENQGDLIQSAANIRRWLRMVGSHADVLFYSEKEFDENEIRDRFYSEIDPDNRCGQDPCLGIGRISTIATHACLTITGWNSGLGCLRLKDVGIPSFGPQKFPLSDSTTFGLAQLPAQDVVIEATPEHLSLGGYTRSFAAKDVWLSIQAKVSQIMASFDVRWVGLTPNGAPFAFVFYVQAKSCTLEDGSIFHPQKVQRYEGKSQKIVFDQMVELTCSEILNMQVIPLAGIGCFWNASFLISFEFTSAQNQANYSFRFI